MVTLRVLRISIMFLIATMMLVTSCGPTQYSLTTSVSPSGAGTVTPTSGTYNASTKVTLIVEPASGYRFDYWSGDATGASNPITLIVDRAKSVTANFKAQDTLTTSPPIYSQVLQTYPTDIQLCTTEAVVEQVSQSGEWLVRGAVEIRANKSLIQYYGTKITLNVAVTIERKTYLPGTKLTVDKNLNWIEVSSWD